MTTQYPLTDNTTDPPTLRGYIFNFQVGSFDPDGKVPAMTQEETDAHNKALANVLWAEMLKQGKGVLYLTTGGKHGSVGDWSSVHKIEAFHSRKSFHNFAGRNGRTDVWFKLDGSTWHGVNIGDSQICRVKRCKS